ncbi:ZIP family metal transporter [Candidatus Woesearchaeota archaeon]|nr:ZIP family metal transporter [Candidatus Woesearchaeota archaeon]
MNVVGQTLIAVVIVSLISLVGALTLMFKKFTVRFSFWIVSFAAGTMVGAAFLDLIPEAAENGGELMFSYVILGLLVFLIIERLLYWYHCHIAECEHHDSHPKAYTYLNLLGDGLHNLLDGAIIAVAFSANTALGIATTIAVIMHEIPQEISDFGLLVAGGFSKKKALLFNLLSAITAIIGALLALYFVDTFVAFKPIGLAIAAGGFLYIALVDLLPELHHSSGLVAATSQILLFVLGIGLIAVLDMVLVHAH